MERQTTRKGGRWKVTQLSSEGLGKVLRRPSGFAPAREEIYMFSGRDREIELEDRGAQVPSDPEQHLAFCQIFLY